MAPMFGGAGVGTVPHMVNPTHAPTRCDAADAPADRLLDTLETARFLGMGKRTVQELVADRKLAFVKIGRSIRFAPADLAAFVEANRVKAAGWKGGTAR
jgi:excisionase family DNA binding protein